MEDMLFQMFTVQRTTNKCLEALYNKARSAVQWVWWFSLSWHCACKTSGIYYI